MVRITSSLAALKTTGKINEECCVCFCCCQEPHTLQAWGLHENSIKDAHHKEWWGEKRKKKGAVASTHYSDFHYSWLSNLADVYTYVNERAKCVSYTQYMCIRIALNFLIR